MKEERYNYKLWPLVIVFFLGIAIALGSTYLLKDYYFDNNYVASSSTSDGTCYTKCENKVTITENGISDSVDKLYDAVVLIENYQNSKLYASGTGFVYKVDGTYGYILTNYHVIAKNTSIKVVMADDSTVEAKYLGGDEYLDVAVIAIPKSSVIKVATIGKSSSAKLGDTVFTVGTPVDYEYRGTVTRGILSGKDRLVSVSNTNDAYVMKVLQTDAAINPGNSGGPLANSNGEVIGMNSLKLSNEQIEGMGFAIAIEDIMAHVSTFEKGEKIIRPYLGISMANINDKYNLSKEGIKIPDNITKGVVILSTVSGSSVDGLLEKNDIITKINDKEIDSAAYLKYELFKYNVGDKIKITFLRDGKVKTIDVTLKKN